MAGPIGIGAACGALIEAVVDPGTFLSWEVRSALPGSDVIEEAYERELAEARRTSGVRESVVVGEALVGGHRVALLVWEFQFLAGSMGVEAAERLVNAVERATAWGLPVVAATASGGVRMQEGTTAFVQLVKIVAAVAEHRGAGLPFISYLRNPTTGGVFASVGSLGQITLAEPGALIGFLGSRVYLALHDEAFPPGVQTAENLVRHGVVDALAGPNELRETIVDVLEVVEGPRQTPVPAEPALTDAIRDVPAWESVGRSRRPGRPGTRWLLDVAANTVTELHGTGEGEADDGLVLALAKFGSIPCLVAGYDRDHEGGSVGPGGLRQARRGMRLAAEWRLPLVTIVDTGGATLSREAEEGGLAAEIARCLADLSSLRTPTVCLLLGQGAGGAALALLPADRVICAQHAWLAALLPEGASAVRYGGTDRASAMASDQGVRSLDLLEQGIVDRVIPEEPDAAEDPSGFMRSVGEILEYELAVLATRPADSRLRERTMRYRRLGAPCELSQE